MTAPAYTTAQIASHIRFGCNARIAWSQKGSIAYVSDSSVVNVTNLTCLDGENWDFCEPHKLYPPENKDTVPINFLSWCPSGSELAVADEHGNLSIYTQSSVDLGGMQKQYIHEKPGPVQQPPEMNRIVGFKWFDTDNLITIMSPAVIQQKPFQTYVKNVDSSNSNNQIARYSFFAIHQYGPYVPTIANAHKQACIALTRRGDIRLFTQGVSDGKYFENSYHIDRDGIAQEAVTFSQASFTGCKSPKDDSLLLTAYSTETETLYIYKVIIEWPALSAVAGVPRYQSQKSNPISTLKVRRVLRQKIIPPINPSLYVSHIHLMAPGPKNLETRIEAELQISFSAPDASVVQKFIIVTRKSSTLHNAFFNRSMENGGPPPQVPDTFTTSLIPSESIVTWKNTIINMGSTNFDSYFYTCFADGTIDIRFRNQYVESGPISNSALVSLHVAGFHFPPMNTVDELCLSHNMCSALYLKDGKLSISFARNTKLPLQKLPQPKPEARFQTNLIMLISAVTLAARHAMAGFHFCCDDVYILMKQTYQHLKIISPDIATQFYNVLIRESYRSINFPLDSLPINQNTKGVSSMNLGRVLTMKAVLGTNYGWTRTPMARVAWSELTLRNLVFAFSFTLKEYNSIAKRNTQNGQSMAPQSAEIEERVKCIGSVLSLIRFLVDLVAFICQELYTASLHPDPYAFIANRKTVAMPLLLGKLSRVLLLICFKVIKYLEHFATKNVEQSIGTNAEKSAALLYKQLRDITLNSSPVNLEFFEQLLSKIEKSMEDVYPSLTNRHQIEEDLVVSATVHPDLKNILNEAVSFFTKHLLPQINIPWLYYYNVDWLGISEDIPDDEVSYYVGDEKVILNAKIISKDSNDTMKAEDESDPNSSSPSASAALGVDASPYFSSNQAKKFPMHPHIAALRQGKEVDYLLKKQISHFPSDGIRSRCARCGELTVWYPAKPGSRRDWEIAFQRCCFCGGNWIKADY